MSNNELLIPIIPAYFSVIEMQLSIEVRDFLKNTSKGLYYPSLTEADRKSYDDGVEIFLTSSDTVQLMALVAGKSDVYLSSGAGTQPLWTHSKFQAEFEAEFVKSQLRKYDVRNFVNKMPKNYRSTGNNVPRSLPWFMAKEFESKHSKPCNVFSRYEDARTMRNRIIHGDFCLITSQSGWCGMKTFSPGCVSSLHTNFVKLAMADIIDYLTMLHHRLL